MLSTLTPQFRNGQILAVALTLLVLCGTASAQSVWPVPQPVLLQLSGDIHADTGGRGFVVASQAGGFVAVTESAVLPIDPSVHELVSANSDWLTMRGVVSGVEVRKSLGSGVLPVDPCPGLVPGGEAQVGSLHCSNGSLRWMNVLAATDLYEMPAGYRLLDVWTSSRVLLEREVDHVLVVGVVSGNPLAIQPGRVLGASSTDLLERLHLVYYLLNDTAVYRTAGGYRILNGNLPSADVDSIGEPLPRQQCIAGDLSANGLVSVESVSADLWLQTYVFSPPATLIRQEPLEAGDRVVCAGPMVGGVFTSPFILRPQAGGDQIFRVSASGLTLIYTAVDPVRGPGRLLSVGPRVFVHYADGSLYRIELPNVASPQTALYAPFESPRPIEAGTAPTDPVREYALARDAVTGEAQLSITARIPNQTPVTTELTLGIDLAQSGFTDIRQVLRHPDWPAGMFLIAVGRKATGSEPAGLVYYSLLGAQTPTPLLDQGGAQPTLDKLVLSGSRLHALRSTTTSSTLMRFSSDGSYQGQALVDASQLVGQADGSVLAIRNDGSDVVVSQLSGDIISWERTFANGCRVLEFDAFPLLACEPELSSNSTVSRLNPQTGATVWQRLITPLDQQLIFQARVAWTQDADLRLLSLGRPFTLRTIAAARLNPATGALLDVSNSITTGATSITALGVYGFPYVHRWIHLLARNGARRQRIGIRVDSNGSITANLMGQSLSTERIYLSEVADRIATNEGAIWYLSGQVQGISTTSARSYPITTLSQPLTLTHTVRPWTGREDRAVAEIQINNPNPNTALAARLHVGLLDCPEISRQFGTVEFFVPANSERTFSCTAKFNRDTPTVTTAYLRQPLNGVLTTDFAVDEISIGMLGRDGFEGEGGQ